MYATNHDYVAAGAALGHSEVVAGRYYRQVTEQDKRDAVTAARLGYLPEPGEKVIKLPPRQRRA